MLESWTVLSLLLGYALICSLVILMIWKIHLQTTNLLLTLLSKTISLVGTKDPLAFQAVETVVPSLNLLNNSVPDASDEAEARKFTSVYTQDPYEIDDFEFSLGRDDGSSQV